MRLRGKHTGPNVDAVIGRIDGDTGNLYGVWRDVHLLSVVSLRQIPFSLEQSFFLFTWKLLEKSLTAVMNLTFQLEEPHGRTDCRIDRCLRR
jgi:hypothetical protein